VVVSWAGIKAWRSSPYLLLASVVLTVGAIVWTLLEGPIDWPALLFRGVPAIGTYVTLGFNAYRNRHAVSVGRHTVPDPVPAVSLDKYV
jgi:hypothetical protein